MSLSTTRLRNQTVFKIFLIEVLREKANKLTQRAMKVKANKMQKINMKYKKQMEYK